MGSQKLQQCSQSISGRPCAGESIKSNPERKRRQSPINQTNLNTSSLFARNFHFNFLRWQDMARVKLCVLRTWAL